MINKNTLPKYIAGVDEEKLTEFIERTIKTVIRDYESFNTREEVLAAACICLVNAMKDEERENGNI